MVSCTNPPKAQGKEASLEYDFGIENGSIITTSKISDKKRRNLLKILKEREKTEKILKFASKNKKLLKNQKLFFFVDYSMSIQEKRFFVFDLKTKKVIFSTYVGHSGYSGDDTPIVTSNVPDTRKTSLGLYKVGKQYYGNFGKSKRLHGLSKTNSNAFRRAIVAHSMPGAEAEDLYSWGCFTFFEGDLNVVFKFMKKGSYLLAVM